MEIFQPFLWDGTRLANLVQFSSSVLLSCRHVREGRRSWSRKIDPILPYCSLIPPRYHFAAGLCKKFRNRAQPSGRDGQLGVQLGRLGWEGGGDGDGIGGLETKKEATARLEPVGRRRAVRPERAVTMPRSWLELKWGPCQAPSRLITICCWWCCWWSPPAELGRAGKWRAAALGMRNTRGDTITIGMMFTWLDSSQHPADTTSLGSGKEWCPLWGLHWGMWIGALTFYQISTWGCIGTTPR